MHKKIKITFIIDVLDSNLAGTENQLIKIINGLNKDKFDLQLICFRDHQWLQENASSLDCATKVITINKFKKPQTYLNFIRLTSFLRKTRPDIVQTFFPAANFVGVLAARLAGVETIISSRRDYGEWMSRGYLLATRFADMFVTYIIANSPSVKTLTVRRENMRADKVKVIYNGIETALFDNLKPDLALKKDLNIAEDDKVVGIVANFRPMKHHSTFLNAARKILQVRSDISFVLVGGGHRRKEMESLACRLGIEKNMHFTGSQQNVARYLSIMDIGVNCSEGEGLSNAVMEYMTAGIPCVVSDAGGNPDLITHDVNGYNFRLDDCDALASLVLRLLDDKATRETFIKNARQTIENTMSLSAMLSSHENFYTELCNG